MIELKLYVSDIDYESLIKTLMGKGVGGGAAALAARALPDSAREELAVKYINSNAEKLTGMLEQAIAKQDIRLTISGAQAAVVEPAPPAEPAGQ